MLRRGQPGLMGWILLRIMPLMQDRSLDLLISSPARYHCATDAPLDAGTWRFNYHNVLHLTRSLCITHSNKHNSAGILSFLYSTTCVASTMVWICTSTTTIEYMISLMKRNNFLKKKNSRRDRKKKITKKYWKRIRRWTGQNISQLLQTQNIAD